MSNPQINKDMVQLHNILGEIRAIRGYLDSISYETTKTMRQTIMDNGYVFEKTDKIKAAVEGIELFAKRYNERLFEVEQ